MNIVITGASRGIGFEIARLFAARENNNIFAIARSEQKLKDLKNACIKENIQAHLYPIVFDLEQTDKIESVLVPQIKQHVGKIDILINNAGLLVNKPFEHLGVDDINRMVNVNYIAAVNLTRSLLHSINRDGHVVNISSMGGFQGSQKFSGLSVYASSKAALASITECLAEEYNNTGISFNCLALGATDTEMLRQAFPGYNAPLNATEMAEFIVEFAVNGKKYFNGKILPVTTTNP
ncbi:MAG: SDR family NAD(P)-dependent oxidoreductase [Bacteroidales bacterium]